jgi:hypothetical protein
MLECCGHSGLSCQKQTTISEFGFGFWQQLEPVTNVEERDRCHPTPARLSRQPGAPHNSPSEEARLGAMRSLLTVLRYAWSVGVSAPHLCPPNTNAVCVGSCTTTVWW